MKRQRQHVVAGIVLALVSVGMIDHLHARGLGKTKQPYLGFSGHLVRVGDALPVENACGMKVDSVRRGTPAWRMGLERGDVVLIIDCVAFRSRAGYLQALRLASQKPSILVLNVRTGRPVRCSCRLAHVQEQGKPDEPDAYYLAVD